MRQLGRIRMGNQVPTDKGRMRPNKLETWRLTSPFKESLDVAAELYGGTVQEWEGAPTGHQWELFTESDTLEILIPPGDMAFSQWMEMWSGGGCQRRCDQEFEQISGGEPCMCPADPQQRLELAAKGEACKPTTRLSVIQPRLPDIGLWRMDIHGWYGAIELAGTLEVLRRVQAVSGTLVPARLRIDQRSAKRDGKTNTYYVPVIELPTLTPQALMTGEAPVAIETETPAPVAIGRVQEARRALHPAQATRPPAPPLPAAREYEAAPDLSESEATPPPPAAQPSGQLNPAPAPQSNKELVPAVTVRQWGARALARHIPDDDLEEIVSKVTYGRTFELAKVLRTEASTVTAAIEEWTAPDLDTPGTITQLPGQASLDDDPGRPF